MKTAIVILAVAFFGSLAFSEEDPQKALEKRVTDARNAAVSKAGVDNARTAEELKAARDKARKAQAGIDAKQNLADLKQKTLDNLASIKEMFAKAEDDWKNQKFGEAGQLYSSVSQATVMGAEEMAETSRGRLIEMEDLAKGHLKNADDNDVRREWTKEVDELLLVAKEFGITKAKEVAARRLIALQGKPEVAGHIEIAKAESLEADGKFADAAKAYGAIASNPRYENTVSALKARRKLEELKLNEAASAKIKADVDARASKEGPLLLIRARNLLLNDKPKEAEKQLLDLVDKFPDCKYADEARNMLEALHK